MFENLSNVKEKAQSLLAECEEYAARNNNPKEANLFRDLAAKNEEMVYQIAIIGFMKRGKSTLLNVLLGRSDTILAPVKTAVCTATITKYLDVSLHSEHKETAIVEFKDGNIQEISYEDLNDFINNKQNNDNEKGVKYIRVYGHFPLVKSSVAIVDTPGKGSVHREHDAIAEEFLPMADAIILAQAVDLPMDADEKQFLSSLSSTEKKKIITVMTKVDSVDEKDKRDSCEFIKKELASIGISCAKVYCTAARNVLNARKEGASEAEIINISRESGIIDLENAIIRLIEENSDQKRLMAHHLNTIEQEIKSYIDIQKNLIEETLSGFTKNVAELEDEKNKILQDKKTFEVNSRKGQEHFNKEWDRAINRFCNKLTSLKKQQVIDRLTNSIDNAGMLSLLQKPKQLPAQIASLVGSEVSDALIELETHLEQIVKNYSEDLDDGIELYASTSVSSGGTTKSELMTLGNMALTGASIATAAGYGASVIEAKMAGISVAVGKAALASGKYTAASTGLGAKIVGTTAASGAAAHGATAAAVTTTVTGLVTIAGAAIGVVIVSRLALGLAKSFQSGNIKEAIPKLVDESFDRFTSNIKAQLAEKKDEILVTMNDYIQEKLNEREEQLDKLIVSIQENDPSYKTELEAKYKTIEGIQKKHAVLKNSIGVI